MDEAKTKRRCRVGRDEDAVKERERARQSEKGDAEVTGKGHLLA